MAIRYCENCGINATYGDWAYCDTCERAWEDEAVERACRVFDTAAGAAETENDPDDTTRI